MVLLDRGADSTIRAGVYRTPLRAAMMRGHREVAALLSFEKRGNLPMTSHHRCSQGRSVNTGTNGAVGTSVAQAIKRDLCGCGKDSL
jgi:hypothetical protein